MKILAHAARLALLILGLGAAMAMGHKDVRLQGAGATFPNPLYQKWVVMFQQANPTIKIDYQSLGSGGGIKAITDKTVAFAGSDAPLNKRELAALGGADKVVQFPTCAGAVVPAYNLPGVADLKFTGPVLADIFLGKISTWNDPRIAELNPGVTLPATPITPAWRTDGSGTTYVFTNYLATQSEEFKGSVGMGKQVKWPVGQGGKGNEGVAAVVQQTTGAIGYIELNYAMQTEIAFGLVKNYSGRFVKASPETVSKAGEGAVSELKGSVLAANIWNQPGDDAYPIAAFTYIIVRRELDNLKTEEEARGLVKFLRWAVTEGQAEAAKLDYAPLSSGVQSAVLKAIDTLTFRGKPVE